MVRVWETGISDARESENVVNIDYSYVNRGLRKKIGWPYEEPGRSTSFNCASGAWCLKAAREGRGTIDRRERNRGKTRFRVFAELSRPTWDRFTAIKTHANPGKL